MEAPPTTVDTAPITGGVAPTRGRGGGMRGSFERGRGRGMGRGHFGGVGGPGGFPSRGGFVPRGGMGGPPMGYSGRGGFAPRGAPPMRGGPGMGAPGGYQGRGGGGFAPRGGPPMRGTGRMPMYNQPPKQHTGVDNNKTVSPVQASVPNQPVTGAEETVPNTAETVAVANADPNVATTAVAPPAPVPAKPTSTGVTTNYTPQPTTNYTPQPTSNYASQTSSNYTTPATSNYTTQATSNYTTQATSNYSTGISPNYRGRGGRGAPRGRGVYNPHNGSTGGMNQMYGAGPPMGGEQGMIRRGGPPRGRGQYSNTGMTRPPSAYQHQQHIVNSQIAPQPSLKRGAPGGPPGPKRGRYEGGPYTQRAPAPKYHQPPHMAPPVNYGVQHQPAPPPPPQSHHGYAQHDPSQTMDPYAQSYAAPQTQTSYNGYGQTAAYSHTAPAHPSTHQASTAYATTEYDQSQYQGYSTTYGQQDTRYQTYGQDYTQQYGAPAVDYSTSQADYSQHAQQSYDERAYAGYDTQAYQQSYSNSTGYY